MNSFMSLAAPLRKAGPGEVPCAGVMRNGIRCTFAPEEGDIYCRRCRTVKPRTRYEYHLATSAPQVPHSAVFDLTEESRLLKRLIAARAAQVKDDNSLILAAGPISDMVLKLQKLVIAAADLEEKKGELISREAAMRLIGNIMSIVADEVQDVEILERINDRILDTLANPGETHEPQ